LLDWGVDGIITMKPDEAVRARAGHLGRWACSRPSPWTATRMNPH